MEALYSALEEAISTFVKHVQQCQEGFDLHSLYHVLLLVLPRSPSGQVESWQHLQRLAHCQPGSGSPDVASSYVDWLASHLQHLSTLKERFDARVLHRKDWTTRWRRESCGTGYSHNLSSPNQWPASLDI